MIKIINLHIAVRESCRNIQNEEYCNELTDALDNLGVEVIDGTLNVFNVDLLSKKNNSSH